MAAALLQMAGLGLVMEYSYDADKDICRKELTAVGGYFLGNSVGSFFYSLLG